MATAPVKSKPLHNFSLPCLKWGGTGTAKSHHASASGTTTTSTTATTNNSNNRTCRPDHEPDSDDRHVRVGSRPARTSRFAFSPSPPLLNNDEPDEVAVAVAAAAEEAVEEAVQKPWKLRPRKPAFPVAGGASKNGNMEAHELGVPVHGNSKSMRIRGTVTAETQCSTEKKNRFWIALSKEEIEEDIFIMTGSRPNRRPKKRPKNVQKQMDSVFPGLWLVGFTADVYKVANTPTKK